MGTLLCVAICSVVALGVVEEPSSKTPFPDTITVGKATLACTGTALRTKFGFQVYALAHYGLAEAAPRASDAKERLRQWIDADAPKAFVLKMLRDVGRDKMRAAWGEGLDSANYRGKNRDALLGIFAEDVRTGDELQFCVEAGGTLSVARNGKVLGSWQDAELAKAQWTLWMGPKSVLSVPEKLVER